MNRGRKKKIELIIPTSKNLKKKKEEKKKEKNI